MSRRRRERVDVLLVERGLCDSRNRAQALVLARRVKVEGRTVDKPGTRIEATATVEVEEQPFVSRGGVKLKGALDAFARRGLDVRGRIAMDVGASTGGFTDCLLQSGAERVHAVDVGYGQLAWKLSTDPRVRVHDRTNIRKMTPSIIGEPIELMVVDCSFISLAKVIPHLPRFLAADADVVALVKPQFELEPGRVGKGGIVRDDADRDEAVRRAAHTAETAGFRVVDRVDSELAGRDGNREVFLWLRWARPPADVARGTPAPGSP